MSDYNERQLKNLEQLLSQLHENDVLNQMLAARDLGYLKEKKSVESLLQILKSERSNKAYLLLPVVITALGNICDLSVATPIIELYQEYKHFVRDEVVAEALGNIGSNLALDLLINFLFSDNSWAVQAAAISLGQIGDVRAIKYLEDRLQAGNSLDDKSLASVADVVRQLKQRLME